jgi:hypothetical protein
MKKFTLVGALTIILLLFASSQGTSQNGIMSVTGNGNAITNPGGPPLVSNNTDYGNVSVGSPAPRTFNIANIAGGGPGTDFNNVTITITGSSAFTPVGPTNIGQIKKGTSTNHIITFTPAATGPYSATVTITTSAGGTNVPYTFTIQGNGVTPQPEIDIRGNGVSIANGDVTPAVADNTDFGNSDVTSGTVIRTFTIFNTGALALNLTGTGPQYVAITGTNAADFSVTANPTTPIGSSGGSTTFSITFNPSSTGIRTATLTILNNDGDEGSYSFSIQGNGTIVTSGSQNINVRGNAIDIPDNDTTPIVADNTDFGNSNVGFTVIATY